jgi:putative MATE family efflux protein
MIVGAGLLVLVFAIRDQYCQWLSADAETASLARSYLLWFIPALMMQFPLVAFGSALRATGIMKPTVAIQAFTVLVNMILAPLLIFGIGFFPRLGVTGAALATFVSIVLANLLMVVYYVRNYRYLRFRFSLLAPDLKVWGAMLRVGLPAGGEFALMTVYIVVVYSIIRDFGAAAQAGFGIGVRVMQAMFLPVIAVAFAVAPVVGQNFGGRRPDRVRNSFGSALAITSVTMLLLTIAAQFVPQALIQFFSKDPGVISVGAEYLQIISFNFLAAGAVFVSSSVFQGIGNTFPPLISSMTRLLLFALPAIILSRTHGFQIRYVWYLSVVSIFLQACVNLLLLRREFQRKLNFEGTAGLSGQPALL